MTVILIMRHAEKSGDPDDPHITEAGLQRALTLADFVPRRFGPPHFIFAAADSTHSSRPYETVRPLSEASGIGIDSIYADQDYGALAQALRGDARFSAKTVVVCWHHGNIPNLLFALKAPDGSYPDPWPRDTFNLIIKFTLEADAAAVDLVTEPF